MTFIGTDTISEQDNDCMSNGLRNWLGCTELKTE